VIGLTENPIKVIYVVVVQGQNMPNAPPDLPVIRGFIIGL